MTESQLHPLREAMLCGWKLCKTSSKRASFFFLKVYTTKYMTKLVTELPLVATEEEQGS